MSDYPTYLIHYGIEGQKWGVRRYQNEDGSLTQEGKEHYGILNQGPTKEGYKQLKKDYKQNVKGATKEFHEVRKESGKDKLIQNRKKQYDAIEKVDEYAYKKASELFNEYKDLKIYKAKLKGKTFDTSKIGMQSYFHHYGIEIDSYWNTSTLAFTSYNAMQRNNKTKITKHIMTGG